MANEHACAQTYGMVYLIGAGPGDPGLLTRAGADALALADVVVYDRLINAELLALARADAERIYVGKAASHHTYTQEQINDLLAQYALQGKTVCRLKGGDPFVFGRGGEEAAHLRAQGVPFRIIPGVTSAIAVPAYAGIPLTDRSCASSFAVITGHEDADKTSSTLDWAKIAAGADTLVFLMGLSNLPSIAAELIAHGRASDTPAAAIMQGCTPAQRVVVGTLADIAQRVATAGLRSPVITVVGEVVHLREQLDWFETQPLFGKRILVTRAREQASALSRRLTALGAEVIASPLIRFQPLTPPADLLTRLQAADWLLLTSANGVSALVAAIEQQGADLRALGHSKIAAIGPATAEALRKYHLKVDFLPTRFIAEAVAEEFPAPAGKRIIIARADEAREVLPEMLIARGALVDVLPVYRTITADETLPDIAALDVITFTSSSTVRNFRQRYPGTVMGPVIACIGPVTADTARELGLPVHIEAEEYTIPGLVTALGEYFCNRSRGPAS